MNLGPLQEQLLLLTAEPSLLIFYYSFEVAFLAAKAGSKTFLSTLFLLFPTKHFPCVDQHFQKTRSFTLTKSQLAFCQQETDPHSEPQSHEHRPNRPWPNLLQELKTLISSRQTFPLRKKERKIRKRVVLLSNNFPKFSGSPRRNSHLGNSATPLFFRMAQGLWLLDSTTIATVSLLKKKTTV